MRAVKTWIITIGLGLIAMLAIYAYVAKDAKSRAEAASRKRAAVLAGLQKQVDRRREQYVEQNPDLPERTRQAILAGQVLIGMTSEAVAATWGGPSERRTRGDERYKNTFWEGSVAANIPEADEIWTYGAGPKYRREGGKWVEITVPLWDGSYLKILRFKGGVLMSVSEDR